MMTMKVDISSLKYPNTFMLIDNEDYHRVIAKGKWYRCRTSVQRGRSPTLRLHRFIMEKYQRIHGLMIDHINHDILDNRKENLRVCTNGENMRNRDKYTDSVSLYKGVWYNKKLKSFTSSITHMKIRYWLGKSKNELSCAAAYNYAAKKLHGEFTHLNNVDYELIQAQKDEIDIRIYHRQQGMKFDIRRWRKDNE